MDGYWRLVHLRAIKEAAAILGLGPRVQIVIKGLAAVVVLLALFFFGSPDAWKDEWVFRMALAAIIVFLFPMNIFL